MVAAQLCNLSGNEHLTGDFYALRLEAPSIAPQCSPGQFILLRGLVADWPYLKRPFSVYSTDGDTTLEIVYKVVGTATSIMARMRPGERFDVLGPLGNGFSEEDGIAHLIALAGGIGIPPVGFYCQKCVGLHERVTLIVGAKTRSELLVPVGLVVQGVEIRSYTEDGSKGTEGTVIDGLAAVLESAGSYGSTKVIACGPRRMLYEAAQICHPRGIRCEVSVEEIMACGVGACMSCAVPSAQDGYLHACTDGPVFDSRAIDWTRWISR
jgi:dihydroorotate dehydrogenase electron transfer subunit